MTDILEMNKSVFETSFKQSSRLTKRTRQAMKSTLVVPACAREMTYEDCEQTDGGGISRETLGVALDITIVGLSFVCAVVVAAITAHTFAKIGKGLIGNILKRTAKNALKKMVSSCWRTFGFACASAAICAVDSIAGILFDFSIGNAVAHLIDYADGNYNGICFG